MIAKWLLILGGVSLGFQGLLGYNLLGSFLGEGTLLERILELAIGASAVWFTYHMSKKKK